MGEPKHTSRDTYMIMDIDKLEDTLQWQILELKYPFLAFKENHEFWWVILYWLQSWDKISDFSILKV